MSKEFKSPFTIFEEMQKLETREEMIEYLRALPKRNEEDA